MPATGDFSVKASTRSRRRAHLECLGIALRAQAAQLELQAVLLEAAGFHGVRVVELGGFEIVAGALEVALRNHVDAPGILGALELAFGGRDLHLGEVGVLAALEDRAPHFDGLAVERGVGARERRALLLVFIGERGALDRAQYVAGLDRVAGAHLIDDGAGRFGEQRGADRGNHRAGGGDVAYEGTTLDDGRAQAFARNHFLRRQPGARAPDDEQQQRRRDAGDDAVAAQERTLVLAGVVTTRSCDSVPRMAFWEEAVTYREIEHTSCQRRHRRTDARLTA